MFWGYGIMVVNRLANGKNAISEETTVAFENDQLGGMGIVVGGNVSFYMTKEGEVGDEANILKNSFKMFSMSKNSFFGAAETFKAKPSFFSAVAEAESSVLKIAFSDKESAYKFFMGRDSYNVFLLQSISDMVVGLNETKKSLRVILKELMVHKENLILFFWKFKSMTNFIVKPTTDFFRDAERVFEKYNHEMPVKFDRDFLAKDNSYMFSTDESSHTLKAGTRSFHEKIKNMARVTDDTAGVSDELAFFSEFSALDIAKKKTFLLSNIKMSLHLACMGSSLVESNVAEIKSVLKDIFDTLDDLASLSKESLFTLFTSTTLELKRNNAHKLDDFLDTSMFIFDYIKEISDRLNDKFEHSLDYYLEDMRYTVNNINPGHGTKRADVTDASSVDEDGDSLPVNDSDDTQQSGGDFETVDVIDGNESLPPDIQNSLSKIISFSDIDKADSDVFNAAMSEFRKTKDKFDTEDDMRKLRRNITNLFFKIYKNIMFKYVADPNIDRLYKMFLDYGFTDERLLDDNQSLTLYKLSDKTQSDINIYSMSEWAKAIHEKEFDPSFNDFGQFYREAIRELVKRATISKNESEMYLESGDKRLEYEIDNMIRSTNKLCYGQISVYVPTLHKDMILTDLTGSFLTREKLGSIVHSIMDIDFSAFYREVLYKNPEMGIEKELIMKEVLPTFILSPTFGSRAMMWQELESTNKSTSGRMVMPTFTNENLEELVIKMFGAFRWELCKNMLGPLWSDISQSSLTAYYSDYVQFYKKNRDLSDEAKEKIKKQLAKSRNNLKDFFVLDYFMWINYEAKGVMRLNKAARQILYRFVPFKRELRDELSKLPMFADDANRFKNIRAKQATEVKNHLHKYTKDGAELQEELAKHLAFYQDM